MQGPTEILAEVLHEQILSRVATLKTPLSEIFKKDMGIKREVALHLAASLLKAIDTKQGGDHYHTERFRSAVKDNLDLLGEHFVD